MYMINYDYMYMIICIWLYVYDYMYMINYDYMYMIICILYVYVCPYWIQLSLHDFQGCCLRYGGCVSLACWLV